jgi:beta-1,4-mannosyl-glycoprotein beta-1,4-N-acetylglucosaminyltransferase
MSAGDVEAPPQKIEHSAQTHEEQRELERQRRRAPSAAAGGARRRYAGAGSAGSGGGGGSGSESEDGLCSDGEDFARRSRWRRTSRGLCSACWCGCGQNCCVRRAWARLALRTRAAAALFAALLAVVALVRADAAHRAERLVTTLSRPLWDSHESSRLDILVNLGWSGDPQQSCALHRMSARAVGQAPRRVIDVLPVSEQLELLELRVAELWPVVDRFVLLFAPCRYSGELRAAPQLFPALARFRSKISVVELFTECAEFAEAHGGAGTNSATQAIEREFRSRLQWPSLYQGEASLHPGDVVLFSDLDEIPRRSTVELLRSCDWQGRWQLQLRSFMYSFEFELSDWVYRSAAISFDGDYGQLNHGALATRTLADAGWHCSWCFASLEEIIAKMRGYGHNDRLRDKRDLEPERVRRKSCSGDDPYGYDVEVSVLLAVCGPTDGPGTSFYR